METIATIGLDLVKGIWRGISDAVGWILEKIKEFGKAVLDGLKKIFGINSPSKETAYFGEMIGAGLAGGILGSLTKVKAASNKLHDVVKDSGLLGGNMEIGLGYSRFNGTNNNYNNTFSPTINVQGGIDNLAYRREINRLMRQQAAAIAR
jgi:hypothetical protein